MSRVYISGPMTGLPDHNFSAFHAAADQLRHRGFHVINPAELNPPGATYAQCLREDILHLCRCDFVVTLPGCDTSRGAQLEISIATALNMPVLPLADLLIITNESACYAVPVVAGRVQLARGCKTHPCSRDERHVAETVYDGC